jgi:hypothetical protein
MRRALFVGSLGGQRHTPTRQSLASPGRLRLTCTLVPAIGSPLVGGLGKQETHRRRPFLLEHAKEAIPSLPKKVAQQQQSLIKEQSQPHIALSYD